MLDEIMALRDENYRLFHSKIVPGIDNMLGLRAPIAKKIAKKYANTEKGAAFVKNLPHCYYDENLVHGYMLGFMNDDISIIEKKIEEFLPYIDNWAVCDTTCSGLKNFFKKPDKVYGFVKKCLESDETYTIRFALVCMLSYYIDDDIIKEILRLASGVRKNEYYVKMAQAWLFSVALVKQYDTTVLYFEEHRLEKWVHNKAISKARESYRMSEEKKRYLNTLKIKQSESSMNF